MFTPKLIDAEITIGYKLWRGICNYVDAVLQNIFISAVKRGG